MDESRLAFYCNKKPQAFSFKGLRWKVIGGGEGGRTPVLETVSTSVYKFSPLFMHLRRASLGDKLGSPDFPVVSRSFRGNPKLNQPIKLALASLIGIGA